MAQLMMFPGLVVYWIVLMAMLLMEIQALHLDVSRKNC